MHYKSPTVENLYNFLDLAFRYEKFGMMVTYNNVSSYYIDQLRKISDYFIPRRHGIIRNQFRISLGKSDFTEQTSNRVPAPDQAHKHTFLAPRLSVQCIYAFPEKPRMTSQETMRNIPLAAYASSFGTSTDPVLRWRCVIT